MNTPSTRVDLPGFSEATRTFARIGLLSFGGPAGQIALMHRVLVEEKHWLSETRFLHALNYCMLLPGPEAMQLATYAGWLLHGVRGGLVAGLLFVLPGAVVITVLSAAYLFLGHVTLVEGLLFGIKAAVLAVVIEALVKVSRRALKTPASYWIAVSAFVAIFLFKLPFPLIIVAAALAGVLLTRSQVAVEMQEDEDGVMPGWTRPSVRRFASTLAVWLGIWFAPLAAIWLARGRNVFVDEALFFSKMASVTFGGAYAVLSYVAQQAVDIYGWLKPDEMLTGLGLAETTPGPLILVLVFVGFLGGARLSGLEPLTGGLLGAVTTLWFTFVPCFLWIFVGAPYVETVRRAPRLSAALAGVTAAVVGIIANLGLWFALHVLFGRLGVVVAGPVSLSVPDWSSFEVGAALIAALAGILLYRHVNIILVVVGAALVGAAWRLV